MIYLIGGPSRSGKSTLAKRFREHIDGQVVSADALQAALHDLLKPEWEPDIFTDVVNPVKDSQPDEIKVKRCRDRDNITWQFFVGHLNEATQISNDNILLDGQLWPDFVAGLQKRHEAVFLVDTSSDQAERLITIRNSPSNEHNWMSDRHYSDERIRKWVSFSMARSKLCVELCKKYNYQYFDIADGGMQVAENRAFEYLLSKRV